MKVQTYKPRTFGKNGRVIYINDELHKQVKTICAVEGYRLRDVADDAIADWIAKYNTTKGNSNESNS